MWDHVVIKVCWKDIKQLGNSAFATEQRTSKQLWNAPINLNILVAPQVLLAHQKSLCKCSNSFSECINNAPQRGGTWVWWRFHISIHIYILSHISTHADNIHDFSSNWCSRRVEIWLCPLCGKSLLQWVSYMLVFACVCVGVLVWANVWLCLFVCAFPVDFCDATEVIGCVTPTKNPL